MDFLFNDELNRHYVLNDEMMDWDAKSRALPPNGNSIDYYRSTTNTDIRFNMLCKGRDGGLGNDN